MRYRDKCTHEYIFIAYLLNNTHLYSHNKNFVYDIIVAIVCVYRYICIHTYIHKLIYIYEFRKVK